MCGEIIGVEYCEDVVWFVVDGDVVVYWCFYLVLCSVVGIGVDGDVDFGDDGFDFVVGFLDWFVGFVCDQVGEGVVVLLYDVGEVVQCFDLEGEWFGCLV